MAVLGVVLTLVLGGGFTPRSAPPADVAPSPSPAAAGPSLADASPAPGAQPPLRRAWGAGVGVEYDPRLAAALDEALAGVDGHVSLAVRDLGSRRGAELAADREQPSASLFKLPVLYSVFGAHLPLETTLLITDGILTYDLGTLELGAGETLSVAEALERMITLSDNASAILLASQVGGTRINADLAALGLSRTHYAADRLTTSASDMLALLERIARGEAVSPSASADMLHLLLRQRVNDRLPRLLPAEARVAHKTGNLPGIVNDVGIVYGPHSTFGIAGLVADTQDEAAAADGLARAALAAYTYLESLAEGADRPRIPPAPERPVPPVWRQARPAPTGVPIEVAVRLPTSEALVGTPRADQVGPRAAAQEPTEAPLSPPTAVPPTAPPAPAVAPVAATPRATAGEPAPPPRPTPTPTLPPRPPAASTPVPATPAAPSRASTTAPQPSTPTPSAPVPVPTRPPGR